MRIPKGAPMDQEHEPTDELYEAQVERALAPYRGLLPARQLAALEVLVRDTLRNDPIAVELLQAARRRATPATSDDKEVPGAEPAASKKSADKGEP